MVNISIYSITEEILEVARDIARRQKTDVKIITPTETVEVRYEKVKKETEEDQEMQSQKTG